ncbi:uncharacterized protein LOC117319148 [Pecten maximus]|uniref:uncharacterized protein LOC117319148 n=1 Tax=Pecten maximus TaxID=6579 RepID=UPI0014591042|nr:uncharacterized protein LOC117319148 [Pecten maximus]
MNYSPMVVFDRVYLISEIVTLSTCIFLILRATQAVCPGLSRGPSYTRIEATDISMAIFVLICVFLLIPVPVYGNSVIMSPNYPNLYPPNVTKTYSIWNVSQSHGDVVSISLQFSFFEMEQCTSCSCDRLEILRGGVITQTFCGSILPNGDGLVQVGDGTESIAVRFISDSNSNVKSGFFAKYNIFVVHHRTTTSIATTTSLPCLPVVCPTCPQDETATYRYYNDRCPAFCECQASSLPTEAVPIGTVVGRNYPMENNETYVNQGYIRTPSMAHYPGRYPLVYTTDIRIDLGQDHIFKDKNVKLTFLHFDIDHCKYGYDGKTCRCDYLTFINVKGLENTRLCDSNNISLNQTYTFRAASRSDRYLELTFKSDTFLVLTGYVIRYEVADGNMPTCQDVDQVCASTHCPMGHRYDFAGCRMCDCITTTIATTTVTTTTPAPTTPKLFKSKLLERMMGLIHGLTSLYNDIRDSRVIDYA